MSMHMVDFREVSAGFWSILRSMYSVQKCNFLFAFKAPSSLMETLEQHLNSLEGKKPGNKQVYMLYHVSSYNSNSVRLADVQVCFPQPPFVPQLENKLWLDQAFAFPYKGVLMATFFFLLEGGGNDTPNKQTLSKMK